MPKFVATSDGWLNLDRVFAFIEVKGGSTWKALNEDGDDILTLSLQDMKAIEPFLAKPDALQDVLDYYSDQTERGHS